jgi:pimeloyl-ACP methyl ester carboxylesterase
MHRSLPQIVRLRSVSLALFSLLIAMVALGHRPAEAALDAAAGKCIASKLKAAGKLAQKQLGCHSKAIKKGEVVDAACLTKASDGVADGFAKAEGNGGCLTEGDLTQVEGLVDGSTNIALAALVTTPASESACTAGKLKAAGKRASKLLKSHGKAVQKGPSKLPDDVAKAAEKFDAAFVSAEEQADCQTTGDATAVAASVDAGLDGLLGKLRVVAFEGVSIPSGAEPAETPGSGSTDASGYPKLINQFGTTAVDLNNATYSRFYYQPDDAQPDVILILVPGFEGGSLTFKILSENLISRALENALRLEVWAFDRRGHQLEDLVGQDLAEADADPQLLLDWYYGGEIGLPLDPQLPGRRAEFHDTHADTPFIANWTNNVISRDIDAVVEAALAAVGNGNVFLGGHSAGTGFTARYAATDFDLSGPGVEAGYSKLRGLVLLEGGGGSSSGTPPTADTLDRIEDRADGGLFGAVRDNAPRCADGTTPCTVATEAVDCAGIGHAKCIPTVNSYAIVPGLLNPRVLAAGEITAIQAINDPDTGENLIGVDQLGPGTSAIDLVPDLAALSGLGTRTALGGLGAFVDDDCPISGLATFVATSAGAGNVGPPICQDTAALDGWQPITDLPLPVEFLPTNGAAPTTLPGTKWGQEVEVTRMDRFTETFYAGAANFTDWYYPSGGLGTTTGLPALDSSALSIGRSRPDIENITEAANVNIPVICFGGSNALTPVPGNYIAFAQSIGTCTTGDCNGATPRVVDASLPNPAFPTYGDADGGFEVHIVEGIAHVDVGTAEDNPDNLISPLLLDFIERNIP